MVDGPQGVGLVVAGRGRDTVALAFDDGGLRRVLLEPGGRAQAVRRLEGEGFPPDRRQAPPWLRRLGDRLVAYLSGDPLDPARLDVRLSWTGMTPFRVAVSRTLRRVPRGRTVTYAELAARAGFPGAARGVGGAMAANPFPLLVPCHRVLPASGGLGGFSAPGGVATKRRLLALEHGVPAGCP